MTVPVRSLRAPPPECEASEKKTRATEDVAPSASLLQRTQRNATWISLLQKKQNPRRKKHSLLQNQSKINKACGFYIVAMP